MTQTTTPMATDNQPTATKKCTKCGRELSITEFHKHSKNKDGLQCWCKQCHKIADVKRAANNVAKTTPPQSVTTPHPILSKMQPREIIAEIRERIGYLRSTGWQVECNLTYTQIREIKV